MKHTPPPTGKSSFTLRCALFGVVGILCPLASHAAVLIPSGNPVDQTAYVGWTTTARANGPVFAPSNHTLTTTTPVTATGTFFGPAVTGFTINPDWTGSFTVTGQKASGGNATIGYNGLGAALDAAPVGSVISFGYLQFSTAASVTDYDFDFSGMTEGYLPAGTLIAVSGMSGASLLAIAASSDGAFLDYFSDADFIGGGGGADGVVSYEAGTYDLSIVAGSTTNSSPGASFLFRTTENLTSLSFGAQNQEAFSVNILAPGVAVPEPSSAMLVLGTSLAWGLRRRRR